MFDFLTETSYAAWVRESWGWPFALTLHAFGNAIIVAFTFIMGMRLIGLFRTIPFTSLLKLFPYMWVGFVVQVFSGFSLWMTKPDKYLASGMFEVKFSLVIIGAILMRYFQNIVKREAVAWDATGKVSSLGMRFVAFNALAWAAVLTTGRLTAYLGQLYS